MGQTGLGTDGRKEKKKHHGTYKMGNPTYCIGPVRRNASPAVWPMQDGDKSEEEGLAGNGLAVVTAFLCRMKLL
jgi:hypothetical protein